MSVSPRRGLSELSSSDLNKRALPSGQGLKFHQSLSQPARRLGASPYNSTKFLPLSKWAVNSKLRNTPFKRKSPLKRASANEAESIQLSKVATMDVAAKEETISTMITPLTTAESELFASKTPPPGSLKSGGLY